MGNQNTPVFMSFHNQPHHIMLPSCGLSQRLKPPQKQSLYMGQNLSPPQQIVLPHIRLSTLQLELRFFLLNSTAQILQKYHRNPRWVKDHAQAVDFHFWEPLNLRNSPLPGRQAGGFRFRVLENSSNSRGFAELGLNKSCFWDVQEKKTNKNRRRWVWR
ncbi:hypothetical protein Ddye_006548 [Dipteronia dyeriana]|uniref:Uncharacterized protein n=1 Tax=Dipteronia dyeriana TaxID=168575 RepID=A0AAD9XIB0_9ROSI|nr:hypothetical protein Ddye_006548 [Dipteronia dyeriana]